MKIKKTNDKDFSKTAYLLKETFNELINTALALAVVEPETPQFDINNKEHIDKFLVALLKIEDVKTVIRHLDQLHTLRLCGRVDITESDCYLWEGLNAFAASPDADGEEWYICTPEFRQ